MINRLPPFTRICLLCVNHGFEKRHKNGIDRADEAVEDSVWKKLTEIVL